MRIDSSETQIARLIRQIREMRYDTDYVSGMLQNMHIRAGERTACFLVEQ